MFPETRSGGSPGPIRITVGIVLMVLVSMWTFVTPAAGVSDAAADAIVIEMPLTLDADG